MHRSCALFGSVVFFASSLALPLPSLAGDGLVWQQTGVMLGADVQGRFGRSVARSGNTLMVGAEFDDRFEPVAGAVYVYERQAEAWVEVQALAPA